MLRHGAPVLPLLILAVVCVVPGCARRAAPPGPATPGATSSAEPLSVSPAPAAQVPPSEAPVQVLDYDISCELAPAAHRLSAQARVQWEAVREVSSLQFDLRPDLKITSLKVGDSGELAYDRNQEGAVTVSLPRPLATGKQATMALSYAGEINGPRGGASKQRVWDYIGEEGTYVRFEAGWYPQVTGDSATADISIKVPAGWSAVASGKLVSSRDQTFHWRTDIPAMGLSFTAAKYVVADGQAGHIPLQCYTFPAHAKRAPEYLKRCGEILALYERLYGPYPFPKFALAEIPDLYGGGHGDQSFVMLQEKSFREPFDGEFVAHEMAHNWWGSLLMCTESEFMQEGFATYSQALYREEAGGKAALRQAMKAQAEAVLIHSMDPDREKSCYESDSGPLLYEKGAWILHMLRGLLGDDKWFAAIKSFASDNAGKIVTCAQLQHAFEKAQGESLDWFFKQWLYGKGVPWVRAQVVSGEGGKVTVKLTQRLVVGEGKAATGETWQTKLCSFRLPVDLLLKHTGGAVRQTVWLTQPDQEAQVAAPGRVTGLTIDPDGWLLCHSKGLVGELDQDTQELEKELEREMKDLDKELERELKDVGGS